MQLNFTVIGSAGKHATAAALQQLAAAVGAQATVRILDEQELLLLQKAVAAGTVRNNELGCVVFTGLYEEHTLTGVELVNCFSAAMQEGVTESVVAQVDTPAAAAAVSRAGVTVNKLASEYGAAADWHLAITSNTLTRTAFVLQGPDNAYFRGRIPGYSTLLANSVALALITLQQAGVTLEQLNTATNRGNLLLEFYADGSQYQTDSGNTVVFDRANTAPRLLRVIDQLETVLTDPPTIVFDLASLTAAPHRADAALQATSSAHLELLGAVLAKHSSRFYLCDSEHCDSEHCHSEANNRTAAVAAAITAGAAQVNGGATGEFIDSGDAALATAIKQSSAETVILYAGVNNPEAVNQLQQAVKQTGQTEA